MEAQANLRASKGTTPTDAHSDNNNNNNNGVSTCTSHAGADVTSTTALVLKESLPHDLWGAECPG